MAAMAICATTEDMEYTPPSPDPNLEVSARSVYVERFPNSIEEGYYHFD